LTAQVVLGKTGKPRVANRGSFAMHRLIVFLSVAALSVSARSIWAQTGADRAQLLQEQTEAAVEPSSGVEGVEDGHAASTPNDADIGEQRVLRQVAQYQPLTFSAACPVFYTSNAALTPNHELSDTIIAPVVGAFYDPRLTQNLYGHLGAREQVFNYTEHHQFDFSSLDAEAGVNYFVPQWHNLILRAFYDFNRLTLDDRLGEEAEFFSNHQLIFNAEMPFRFGQSQQIAIGADANISVAADHQSPRRNDYEGYVGYSANLTRAFSIGAVGRVVGRDYHQNGRTDVSEIVSLTASYRIRNWLWVSAFGSYAHSDSNRDIFDYDVANAGGSVALTAKF
jgi:hypothetical protein